MNSQAITNFKNKVTVRISDNAYGFLLSKTIDSGMSQQGVLSNILEKGLNLDYEIVSVADQQMQECVSRSQDLEIAALRGRILELEAIRAAHSKKLTNTYFAIPLLMAISGIFVGLIVHLSHL